MPDRPKNRRLITKGRRRSFQARVLDWYGANRRDLPWRHTTDPYAILVSEILSHQTQISRVVPVYRRLLRRYPTVEAMARASPKSVKRITDPLGYKIRGSWLHSTALRVAESGSFPSTLEGLRELPGVGRYTAGALMNFAYRQDTAMVDTNIARVLSRHFETTTRSGGRATVWEVAREIIPTRKGHLINQALMDIGALICTAKSLRCLKCPLRRSCDFRAGRQARITVPAIPHARRPLPARPGRPGRFEQSGLDPD